MKRLLFFILFLLSLFFMIPYMLTVSISKLQEKHMVDLNTYHSGYTVKISEKNVDMEQFIAGILPTTISLEKKEEVLKAQAVILRTQIRKKMGDNKTILAKELPYQYEDDNVLKKKIGAENFVAKNKKRERAVIDTLGKCLVYNDVLIDAYYHELSVGTTLDGQEWFQKEIPYLKEKSAFNDTESDDYVDTREYTYGKVVEILENKLKIKITTDTAEKSLTIIDATKNGYVRKIQAGTSKISGTRFANCFNLPSANFYFEHYDGKFRILTLGKGSGLGMSQNTANEMAEKEKTYEQILKYFFPKTKIKAFSE
ncbi:MAG: SpoIID/LytB domain-containing protein [Anaerostipes sp.]|nr:SpoIID/LytB domain-containing protein [Anaerostipes sp.]